MKIVLLAFFLSSIREFVDEQKVKKQFYNQLGIIVMKKNKTSRLDTCINFAGIIVSRV